MVFKSFLWPYETQRALLKYYIIQKKRKEKRRIYFIINTLAGIFGQVGSVGSVMLDIVATIVPQSVFYRYFYLLYY